MLAAFGFKFFDAFRGRQFFRHGAAEFMDCCGELFSNFEVGPVCGDFTADSVTPEFFFGLESRRRDLRRVLCTAHVVEYLLVLLQGFALMDCLSIQATVEAHIAVVLEDGVVDRFNDTGVFCGVCELRVVLTKFLAKKKSAFFFDGLVRKFLPACLKSEIGLAEGNDFLTWIGVLNDEVAGIAGEVEGWD